MQPDVWEMSTGVHHAPHLRAAPPASFFSGVYSWLVMTFNYLILWVRVKGQG